jgi:PAS domain S-box-containing protein
MHTDIEPDGNMWRMTFLSAFLLIVGCFLVYIVWSGYSSHEAARESVRRLYKEEVARRALAAGSFLSELEADLERIAGGTSLREFLAVRESKTDAGHIPSDSKISKSLNTLIGRDTGFHRIIVSDRNGKPVTDISDGQIAGDGLEKNSKFLPKNNFSIERVNGAVSLVLSVPVIGENGYLGTVSGGISSHDFSDRIKKIVDNDVSGIDFLLLEDEIIPLSKNFTASDGDLKKYAGSLKNVNGLQKLYLNNGADAELYTACSIPVQNTPIKFISIIPAKILLEGLNSVNSFYYSLVMLGAIILSSFYLLKNVYSGRLLKIKMEAGRRREADLEKQRKELEREVLDRELAESLRVRAEVRYRDLFDNASVGIFQIDSNGKYVSANNALAEIFGYRDSIHIIEEVDDIAEQLFEDRVEWDGIVAMLRARRRLKGIELRVKNYDGSFKWIKCDLRLAAINSESSVYIEGFVNDIHLHKIYELKLADSERRFRSLFHNAPVSLWELEGSALKVMLERLKLEHGPALESFFNEQPEVVSELISELRVLDVNQTTVDVFLSQTKAEFCENGVKRFVDRLTLDFFKRFLLAVVAGEKFFKGEVLYDSKSGIIKTFEVQCSFVFENEEKIFKILSFVEDVTESKKFENELQQARDEAQQANEIKGRFLANMSHEFRTPMNAIIGLSQLMLSGDIEEGHRDNLRLIKSSAGSLLELVNDILDLSKVDSGFLSLQTEPLDLKLFLNEIVDLISIPAAKENVSLNLQTENLPEYIIADGIRLRQIMINLLSNAVKFSSGGRVVFKVVSSEVKNSNEKVELDFEIIDDGIGLPDEMIKKLFDPFVQGSGEIYKDFGGTGLGLAICSKLVELMKGHISASNNSLGGATFHVELPFSVYRSKQEALEAVQHNEDSMVLEDELKSLKVLIADDCKMNRIVLKKILSRLGIKDIQFAEDGREAINSYLKNEFNLIFMDVQMPNLDGISAAGEIRRQDGDIKIIALTGDAQESTLQSCHDAGMDGALTKPVDAADLIDIIRKTCIRNQEN